MLLVYMICMEIFLNGVKMFVMITIMELLLMVVLGKMMILIKEFIVAAPGSSILGGVALRSATSITRSRRSTTFLVFVL